ncbi:type I polyketide synthase [Actinomadura chibensis]|uniref:SDR family oxidoreductase n=1 Tax=Actinomadura chibensis TaxID=392828 RepID=A0A5D0NM68_9ACTN|nr:type I polyketide synthase [Actinomadura chibensis]TYB45610.1 SDR family oxidoreductase [Actinomadura chibensis]
MSAACDVPIAIIGVGCRFPGGVETPAGLWRLAADGRQTAGPVPAERWDAGKLALLHDPELRERTAVGCFLDGDVWAWEPEALSVAPAEQDWVDPQARVLMETAWEAVEHAGIPVGGLRGTRTGVYVGTYAVDNLFREERPVEDAPNSPYLFGNYHAGPAGRVAFSMDLRGPVMVIGTHCSAGMVAVDTACGALTLDECDAALAGGVMLMLAPQTHYLEAPLLLSGRGACHAFDARADGYVRGEGAGVLLLKRLVDARRDGDRVLAVILGSAVNNDGQAARLTAPSSEMQQALFRDAVARARVDPGDVGLVEAHGPGTMVGDPIEYASINAVYGRGRGRCALGSVKTNIGHTEPVSGVAGVIKAIECLRRGAVPPNQNFAEWNPAIVRDDRSRLFVPTSVTAWPVPDAPRLAAVCSYGVAGTNGHLVLEATPARPRRVAAKRRTPAAGPRLFLLSGNSAPSLAASATRLAGWTEREGAQVPLQDVAHTLALRRGHADHRLGIVARDHAELGRRCRSYAAGEGSEGWAEGTPVLPPDHRGPVFVFTGQGSQYAGMCRGLLAHEPVFAAAIDELEPLIRAESGFSLRELILEPGGLTGVDRIQPTLFGIQVALASVWRSWGLEPAAVIGQSLGEVAASVVAGVLAPEDGAKVICRRAALLARIAHGAMASVMLDLDAAREAIEAAGADGVSIGVVTAPHSTVVSGDARQVRALVEAWNASGAVARMVDVDVASHSAQVDPITDELRGVLSDLGAQEPGSIVFYSTVRDDPREPGPLDASYWVRNQRDTVHFQRAVEAALADGHRLFIECTPHPLATGPVQDTARAAGLDDVVAVGSLRRGVGDPETFLYHLATAHAAGCDGIDFGSRYGDGDLAELPGTAWNRTRHGGDHLPHVLVAPRLPAAGEHALLGGSVTDPEDPDRHLWQTPVSPRTLPWLGDHRVAGTPVLPGTGFAEMLLAAGAEVFGTRSVALGDLRIERPLVLDPEPRVTTLLVRAGDHALGQVLTRGEDGRVVHAHGTVRALDPVNQAPPCSGVLHSPDEEWSDSPLAALQQVLRGRHDVFHGPAFSALSRIQIGPDHDRAVARLSLADGARVSASRFLAHPALVDEMVQTVVAAWLDHCALSPGPVVVSDCGEIIVHGPTGRTKTAHVRLHEADDLGCRASGVLVDGDGAVLAEVRDLRLTNITPAEERYTARLYHLDWVPEEPAGAPVSTGQRWLVVHPRGCLWAERLAELLGVRTAGSATLVHPAAPLDSARLRAALDGGSAAPTTHVVIALDGEDVAPTPQAARSAVARTLAVLRELSARRKPPRLWVMWRGDDPLAAAGVRGLLRAAAFEHPDLLPSALEVAAATPLEAVLPDLLGDPPAITEIAWRHGVRTVARVKAGRAPDTVTGLPHPVREGAAYVVSGGLGGLGLLAVRRLAERGAGRVVVCGRREPAEPAAEELARLRAAFGTELPVVTGDVADPAIVHRLVDVATRGGLPLRGVLHAAGVVEDATLVNLDDELLGRVWRGKAEGAWALHQATRTTNLDFFVVYSSIASLLGSPGQGAYAAANAYLDALVAHRVTEGLPATGIQWGAWGQVGRGRHLAQRGFVTISPEDGADALERILKEGHHQIAYSALDVDAWTAPYPATRSSTLLASLCGEGPSPATTTFPARLRVLATQDKGERRRIVEGLIIGEIRDLLGGTARYVGPHTSMVMLGIDSLGAIQLQQRLQSALGIDIKPGVIWVKPTAASLADWILGQLDSGDVDPHTTGS